MVVLEPNYHHHHKTRSKKQPVVVVSAPPRCRPAVAAVTLSEKVSSAVRVMAFVIQKITAVAAERGNKIIGRSLSELAFRHNAALGCSSDDVRLSFVSPRDVEFSCTSSPPHRARRRHLAKPRRGVAFASDDYHRRLRRHLRRQHYWNAGVVEAAPPTPVYGTARSDCSSRRAGAEDGEAEGGFHVDKAAEEFIERFYRELMMQKWAAAREGSDRYV